MKGEGNRQSYDRQRQWTHADEIPIHQQGLPRIDHHGGSITKFTNLSGRAINAFREKLRKLISAGRIYILFMLINLTSLFGSLDY